VHVLGKVEQAEQAEAEDGDGEDGDKLEERAPYEHHRDADEQCQGKKTVLRHSFTSFPGRLVVAAIIRLAVLLNNAPIGCQQAILANQSRNCAFLDRQ
jgi:hypothetical protein